MKKNSLTVILSATHALAVGWLLSGCASSDSKSSGAGAQSSTPNRFLATDGRTIDIGKSAPADGGTRYNNPHMETDRRTRAFMSWRRRISWSYSHG
jgi:hypothetical protein